MSRGLGPAGEALIKGFETLQLTAYRKYPGEPWTCGWGHTGPDVGPSTVCDEPQADAWFLADTAKVVAATDAHTPLTLTQNQFDALVSFGYNLGISAEEHSTLLRDIMAGDLTDAAEEFLKWNHVNGQVSAGLTRRRQAERALFLAV
jgi:lysozyme